MRWIWIDRFELFEPGVRAVAVKNVSLAEDHLHDHFPGFPIMPTSLMVEGMAQTAGILVGEARNARIEQLTESAATTSGRITVGDELIGEVDIVFSHIDQNLSGLEFPEENFVFTEAFMSLLNAVRQRSGERISV